MALEAEQKSVTRRPWHWYLRCMFAGWGIAVVGTILSFLALAPVIGLAETSHIMGEWRIAIVSAWSALGLIMAWRKLR